MKRMWVWCCLLLLGVQIMTWVSATSRLLAPNHDDHSPPTQDNGSSRDPFHVKTTSEEVNKIQKGVGKTEEKPKESYKDEKKIGSRPPSCENKCYGCSPCEAIQVPTITAAFTIQYANYFPEGWKCKCGPSFYSP
ncbi:hypothetical protein Droror1_Dr00006337 [Drosera rotundifolia]